MKTNKRNKFATAVFPCAENICPPIFPRKHILNEKQRALTAGQSQEDVEVSSTLPTSRIVTDGHLAQAMLPVQRMERNKLSTVSYLLIHVLPVREDVSASGESQLFH